VVYFDAEEKLSLLEIPAVTKAVSCWVVKMPARQVKCSVPSLYDPKLCRERITEKTYILRDAEQIEIGRYHDPAELLAVIEDINPLK